MTPPRNRSARSVLALTLAATVLAGCSNRDLADPDGALPPTPPTPSTVWELIDRVAVDPADTIAEARAIAGGPVEPFGYGGRFESEVTVISDELRQVQLFTGYTASGRWTFTGVDVTLDRCVPITEVVSRYPGLVPAGAMAPSRDAERYFAQDKSWGTLTVAFRVDNECLAGLGMTPYGRE